MLTLRRIVNIKRTLSYSWFQVVLAINKNLTLIQCLKLTSNKHTKVNIKLTSNKHTKVNINLTLLFSWFQVMLAINQNPTLTQCLKLTLNKRKNIREVTAISTDRHSDMGFW